MKRLTLINDPHALMGVARLANHEDFKNLKKLIDKSNEDINKRLRSRIDDAEIHRDQGAGQAYDASEGGGLT